MQSNFNKKNYEHTASRVETSRSTNDRDGEVNECDTYNQDNEIQDNPIRPSETNELRTPIKPSRIPNFDLDDTVIENQHRTGDDYNTYQNDF